MAKVGASEVVDPKQMEHGDESSSDDSSGKIRLKKELGLFDGVSIIVGVIVGSGIFVSPNMTLKHAGSLGMSLIVWSLSGVISMIGALCYAELGTMIPKSGGDYAYISDAFGPLPAFLYLWVGLFVLIPAGNAVTAITFARNLFQSGWPCGAPDIAIRLIAAFVVCFLTLINCVNVKWATRVQGTFTTGKIIALLIIFGSSLYYLGTGKTENLQTPMAGTTTSLGGIAIAIYSCLFSYSGWNFLNFVTEELKDPYRNLPRAIVISLPIVTSVYVITNFAYFAVLSREEFLSSNAVAITFSEKITPALVWVMPLFVAGTCFGSLNGAIYASSRLFFVGARNGHLPVAISLIDIKRLTPVPSLIFSCLITLSLLPFDESSLLICTTFVEAVFIFASVSGLLWLRHKKPDLHRPIRVNLVLPITFLIICSYLVIFPFFEEPMQPLVGLAFILAGVPVYMATIAWKNKPPILVEAYYKFNMFCAKFFVCLPEDSKEL